MMVIIAAVCSALHVLDLPESPQPHVSIEQVRRDFPGGPVVKTLRFQCRGHMFDPWSGN